MQMIMMFGKCTDTFWFISPVRGYSIKCEEPLRDLLNQKEREENDKQVEQLDGHLTD